MSNDKRVDKVTTKARYGLVDKKKMFVFKKYIYNQYVSLDFWVVGVGP